MGFLSTQHLPSSHLHQYSGGNVWMLMCHSIRFDLIQSTYMDSFEILWFFQNMVQNTIDSKLNCWKRRRTHHFQVYSENQMLKSSHTITSLIRKKRKAQFQPRHLWRISCCWTGFAWRFFSNGRFYCTIVLLWMKVNTLEISKVESQAYFTFDWWNVHTTQIHP